MQAVAFNLFAEPIFPEIDGIIVPFNKTPVDIACGPFYEVRWAFGCYFDCAYCYLRGTARGDMTPRYRPVPSVLRALDKAFKLIANPTIFNSGELSDSLMNPSRMEPIVNKFEEQNRHKLFLLTKSSNVKFLVEKPRKQTIVGFSINAPEVARRWEHRTAPPEMRIEAAKAVYEAGYDTRIRIDPIFPIENWREHYRSLIDLILSRLTPQRIILGTPRGLRKTLLFAKDLSWTQYFTEDSGWGKKLAFEDRKAIYEFFFGELCARGYDKSRISMCKETLSMWKEMGLHCTPRTCACYGKADQH